VIVLGIMVAGAAGALVRYLVDIAVTSRCGRTFPWGTLVINASGSAVLGVLTGLTLYHGFPHTPATILGTGFCGGYTTFSTSMVDTVRLARAEEHSLAVRNVLANVLLAVAAAGIGMAAAAR
jgi:fluoride exporter